MRRRSIATTLSTTALAATATLAVSGTASAEPDWDELAECESSGNWSTNTGNGYQGGLQFSDSTWDAYGGEEYASSAHQASREEQIAVGQRVLEGQGSGAWPGCSVKTGWEGGGTSSSGQSVQRARSSEVDESADSVRSAPTREEPPRQVIVVPSQSVPTLGVKPRTIPPGGKVVTVVVGDTLTKIALIHKISHWGEVHRLNGDVVEHPDWIFPGEQLVLPAPTR